MFIQITITIFMYIWILMQNKVDFLINFFITKVNHGWSILYHVLDYLRERTRCFMYF